MTDEEFEEIVRAALDSLPEEIARGLENVAVVVEDERPGEPGDLGIFSGYPRGEPMPSGALPAKIVIYRRPLEATFPIPTSCAARSGSPSSTSSRTTSDSTRTALDELGYASGSSAECDRDRLPRSSAES